MSQALDPHLDERWSQPREDQVRSDELELVVELAWHFLLHAPDWPAAQAVRGAQMPLAVKASVIDRYQRDSGRRLLREVEISAALTAHVKPERPFIDSEDRQNGSVLGAQEHAVIGDPIEDAGRETSS